MATALLWEVCPNIEWFLIRCQKNRQRPAPGSSSKLASALIDIIEVWTLLPVNLDVDKIVVHYSCNFVVFKRLMGHDMAPVTCAIADTEEDRFILFFCPL